MSSGRSPIGCRLICVSASPTWSSSSRDRTDGPTPWGSASTWFEEDDDLSPADAERLLADIAFSVADNLWPDEDTEPWPPWPLHGGHPQSRHGRRHRRVGLRT